MRKPTSYKRRRAVPITSSRWAAYATAGAASALGAATAEANITYSGLIDRHFNAAVGTSSGGYFELDQPGDFIIPNHGRLVGEGGTIARSGSASFIVDAVSGLIAGFTAAQVGVPYASKLPFGQNISTRPFIATGAALARYYSSRHEFTSPWREPGIGFVGFRFNGGAGLQYGWARINMDGAPENSFTLIDYAFADPGERIRAGQTATASVPESGGSLGLLAIGCAGLLAWRAARQRE